jgi:hypothetical protein
MAKSKKVVVAEPEPVVVAEPEPVVVAEPEPKPAKAKKEPKSKKEPTAEGESNAKKPLNEYQVFINTTIAELKASGDNDSLKYMELRAIANTKWRELHPVDPEKAPRKPRVKKEKEPKPVKEAKAKRPPTAYNMFISAALIELKAEHANADPKPSQKDMMKLAAEKWRAYKAENATA